MMGMSCTKKRMSSTDKTLNNTSLSGGSAGFLLLESEPISLKW